MNKAINQYKNVSVESGLEGASPYLITKKLIDGCMIFLKQAKVAIHNKDFEKKAFHISKAQAIITTLASSLQVDKSEQVANNLLSLYDFCIGQLIDASSEMDITKLEAVEKVMGEIKAGWDAIPQDAIQEAELLRAQASAKVESNGE